MIFRFLPPPSFLAIPQSPFYTVVTRLPQKKKGISKMTNRKLEREMRKFLKQLDSHQSIDYCDPITRQCVYECNKRGYVSGYRHCLRMADNHIAFDYNNPCVEKSGYEFLYPKRNWIAIWTLIASVITAIGVILQLILQFAK
jgi:hypothetical protein